MDLSRKSERLSRAPLAVRVLGLCCFSLPVLICMGCGSGAEAYVSGEVTVDGTSLESGRVVFSPKGGGATQGATGKIDRSGRYEVQSGTTGGLNAGEYAVTIAARERAKPSPNGGPPAPGKLLTPSKYRSAGTTDLFVEVKPGSNKIDLSLNSQ